VSFLDLTLQGEEERLGVAQELAQPKRDGEGGEGALFPPAPFPRLAAVVDEQAAPVGFELFARAHELFALPVEGAGLFFRRARHPHHGQLFLVAFDITAQLQAEGARVAPVGLDPALALIQLLRRHHFAAHTQTR
jgi:hypothetical protein